VAGLAAGSHTLTVQVTGTKSAASGGSWVWVDAFEETSATAAVPAVSTAPAPAATPAPVAAPVSSPISVASPLPTSLTFSSSTIAQGDCYTVLAGNGANMTIDIQLDFPGGSAVVSPWTTLNGNGASALLCTSPEQPVGAYVIHSIRNTNSGNWVPVGDATIQVTPRKPVSLSFNPGVVSQGGCYTVMVGNGANMTIDIGLIYPGGAGITTSWVTLDGNGQSPLLCTSPAQPKGNYNVYGSNFGQLLFFWILPTLFGVEALVFFLFLALQWVVRDSWKAASILSLTVIVFLSYGQILNIMEQLLELLGLSQSIVGRNRYLMPAWITLFALLLVSIVRQKHRDNRSVVGLNVFALLLISMPVGRVIADTAADRHIQAASPLFESFQLRRTSKGLPSIYYIILDAHGRTDGIKECYYYDNSSFIQSLRNKGFYIASDSVSNYLVTALSLTSSLNGSYLEALGIDRKTATYSPTFPLIEFNQVETALRSIGYRIVRFPSGWGPTHSSRAATVNYGAPYIISGGFLATLMQTSVIRPLLNSAIPLASREQILYDLDHLGDVASFHGPQFVFVHIIAPHPPFVFDSFGNSVTYDTNSGNPWLNKRAFADEVAFLDEKVQRTVDEILLNSDSPPIIIVQGDHGPECSSGWENPTPEFLRIRSEILNAYYLPNGGDSLLYNSITPVNSFRVVFNAYFGAKLGLLPDVTYFSYPSSPFNFIEVSKQFGLKQR